MRMVLLRRECWPGRSAFPDVDNPAARDWWAGLFSPSIYQNSTTNLYIWNDMNEPTVFDGPEVGGAGVLVGRAAAAAA